MKKIEKTEPTSTQAPNKFAAFIEEIKAWPQRWETFKEVTRMQGDTLTEELINIIEVPQVCLEEGVPVVSKIAKRRLRKLIRAWHDYKSRQLQELVGDVPPLHERRLFDEQTGEDGKPVKRRMDNANSTNYGEIDGDLGKMPLLDDKEQPARMGYHFRPLVEKFKDNFKIFSKYEPPGVNPDLYYELALEALFLPRSHRLLVQLKQKARRWVKEYDLRKLTREQQYLMVAKSVAAAFFIHPEEEKLRDKIERNLTAMRQHEKFWKVKLGEGPQMCHGQYLGFAAKARQRTQASYCSPWHN